MQLLTGIALQVKDYINVVVFNVDEKIILAKYDKNLEKDHKEIHDEMGSKKLPVFKYYKNVPSDEKSAKAYELVIPKDSDLTSKEGIEKVSEVLIDEMKGGIEHTVMDIGDSMMSGLARQATD